MNKRRLGRTDLHVSELGLDATHFTQGAHDSASLDLLDTYHAGGGRFILSSGVAPATPAAPVPARGSEELVGRWHASSGINRASLVLASRMNFIRPARGGSIGFANLIRESVEDSLRRLRTGHLDLLVCDWDDHLAPVEDLLEAADRLIRAGLVRYVVAGGFPSWRVVDSVHRSLVRNHARFEAIQADYSLLTPARAGSEMLDLAREHRLGFIAGSPLAAGRLTRRPLSLRELINVDRNWQLERSARQTDDALLKALAEIADRRLATPGQIALAWVLRNPQVSSAIMRAATANELRQLMRAADIILTNEDIFALGKALADHPVKPSTLKANPGSH